MEHDTIGCDPLGYTWILRLAFHNAFTFPINYNGLCQFHLSLVNWHKVGLHTFMSNVLELLWKTKHHKAFAVVFPLYTKNAWWAQYCRFVLSCICIAKLPEKHPWFVMFTALCDAIKIPTWQVVFIGKFSWANMKVKSWQDVLTHPLFFGIKSWLCLPVNGEVEISPPELRTYIVFPPPLSCNNQVNYTFWLQ